MFKKVLGSNAIIIWIVLLHVPMSVMKLTTEAMRNRIDWLYHARYLINSTSSDEKAVARKKLMIADWVHPSVVRYLANSCLVLLDNLIYAERFDIYMLPPDNDTPCHYAE